MDFFLAFIIAIKNPLGTYYLFIYGIMVNMVFSFITFIRIISVWVMGKVEIYVIRLG